MRQTGRRRTGRKRRTKQTALWWYKLAVIVILLVGGIFICQKLSQLWEMHKDMEMTVLQEQRLSQENQALQAQKQGLEDPEEVARWARKEFGLVKPGEIPYVK